MLKINIISVGTKPPAWCQISFEDFSQRLKSDWELKLIEIPMAKRSKKSPAAAEINKYKQEEAINILNKISNNSYTIALDVLGKLVSTESLADTISQISQNNSTINFIIGGPDGLDQTILNKADLKISLSKMTFPHMLVRTILAEQLYRAWTIINKHPYHRAN